MGTGKSTVGRRLAERTGRTFVDIDQVIETKHGPIEHIFADGGEAAFRAFERQAVSDVAPLRNHVISTGGGTLLDDENVIALAGAEIITLTATPEAIVERVSADGLSQRPLLADADDPLAEVERLLAERQDSYDRFTVIDTTGQTVDEIIASIGAAGIDVTTPVVAEPEGGPSSAEKTLYAIITALMIVLLVIIAVIIAV